MKVERAYYFQFFYLCFCVAIMISIHFIYENNSLNKRTPASLDNCSREGNCPFLIIGHRGAPHIFAENTINSFQEAIDRGANALEIDLAITKDKKVVVIHDRDPNDFIALARQAGLEGLPFIPYVPNLGSNFRIPVEKLTLYELLQHFGYARNEGIIHNILFEGVLENSAIIPPLEEMVKAIKDRDELVAIFLDIKLTSEQEDLAEEMAEIINNIVANQKYKVYITSPYKNIVNVFYDVLQRSSRQNYERPILDMETSGALKNIDEMQLEGILTGKTILRSENSFLTELDHLLDRQKNSPDRLYPIIAWTIDEQFLMYKLLQKNVNGIITNRPRDLSRLVIRHWKDHSLVSKHLAKCLHDFQGFNEYQFCASGREINPFQSISKREVLNWVCREEAIDENSRDQFGCAFLNREEVIFRDEIDNSGQVDIWYSPDDGGSVVVHKTHENYGPDKIPLLLDYRQTSCHDGFLNSDCEYKIILAYLREGIWRRLNTGNKIHESEFFVTTNVPSDATELRVTLVEMDGEEARWDKGFGSLTIPLEDGAFNRIVAEDKTFQGTIKLKVLDFKDMHDSFQKRNTFGLEYTQDDCSDGFLNYDCEYKIKVEFLNDSNEGHGYYHELKNQYKNFESSFAFYSSVPQKIKRIRVTLYETDDGDIDSSGRSQWSRIINLKHGRKYSVKAPNGVFKGSFRVKMFEYDHLQQHSEGLSNESNQPHNISLPHLDNK